MKKQVSLPMSELSPVIEQCIENGSEVIINITGNSMRPFLKDRRDQVVLIKPEAEMLKKLDVPLYRRKNGKYVLHRIFKCGEKSYTMLGDAQVTLEPDIEPEQIIALSKAFIRKGKRFECNSFIYKSYSYLWYLAYPLRKFYFFSRRTGGKILRALNLRK